MDTKKRHLGEQLRFLREAKSMTQQSLADAAGVSLSTVRRLEREEQPRFHTTTEGQLEWALGLQKGAFAHLRNGGSIDEVFRKSTVFRLGRGGPYGDAPLSDILAADSWIAKVMASGLADWAKRSTEEFADLSAGRLVPWGGGMPDDRLYDWLPWQAQVLCNPPWLHRIHDSAEQLREVLEAGELPRPLRLAEAVLLVCAWDRAWAIDTNAFFHEGEEIDDVLSDGLPDEVRDLYSGLKDGWHPESSPYHPFRWWERRDDSMAIAS